MKIIRRTSIILAAALVIVGLAFGLSKTSFVQGIVPTRGFERRQPTSATISVDPAQASTDTATENSQTTNATPAQPEFRGEHRESGGLSNILQVLQSLVIIALIVLPFAVVPRLRNGGKKGSSSGEPQPPLDQETYA